MWSYLLIGDEVGSATDIDRLFVSSGPFCTWYTNFHLLIGNDDFWSFHTGFRPEISPKKCNLSFLGYLGEIVSDSQTVWTCIYMHICTIVCATVSASSPNL